MKEIWCDFCGEKVGRSSISIRECGVPAVSFFKEEYSRMDMCSECEDAFYTAIKEVYQEREALKNGRKIKK